MNSRMNATPKSNMPANTGSFIAAPINSMRNMAANAANSVTNTVNNVANSVKNSIKTNLPSIYEPLNDSIESAQANNDAPFVSISIIITLGIFVILFIIVVMFHEQIVLALELAWHKIKSLFGYSSPPSGQKHGGEHSHPGGDHSHPGGKHGGDHSHPEGAKHEGAKHEVDHAAVNKLMPSKKEAPSANGAQVFNVATNKYKYSDAEPLCKAFGAELATYDQVKEAWNKGADWCNYGWVKGQAAVYPTQQSTYDKLQAGPEGQREACGVPGVNGGYFDNPELRFGVNCYGAKPTENEVDQRARMSQKNHTNASLEYDHKVSDYKAHMNEIPVNPFSNGVWTQ